MMVCTELMGVDNTMDRPIAYASLLFVKKLLGSVSVPSRTVRIKRKQYKMTLRGNGQSKAYQQRGVEEVVSRQTQPAETTTVNML